MGLTVLNGEGAAMRVGMIGIGGIGGGIAASLLAKGHQVDGYDRDAKRLAAFADGGGHACASAAEAAAHAEIVFACLPSAAASMETARIVAEAPNVRHYVELSTLGRDTIGEIAAIMEGAGKGFLDCPISGGPHIARAGQLSAVIAGNPESVAAARPAIEAFATRIFVVGDTPGLAQVCKIVNNILSVTAFVASCEAISIGVKAGADAAAMIDFINVSTGRNSATLEKFPRAILPRTFDYGGPLTIGQKDLALFLDLARETKVPSTVGSTVANMFNILARELGPDADYSNIYRVFEKWAGLPDTPRQD